MDNFHFGQDTIFGLFIIFLVTFCPLFFYLLLIPLKFIRNEKVQNILKYIVLFFHIVICLISIFLIIKLLIPENDDKFGNSHLELFIVPCFLFSIICLIFDKYLIQKNNFLKLSLRNKL